MGNVYNEWWMRCINIKIIFFLEFLVYLAQSQQHWSLLLFSSVCSYVRQAWRKNWCDWLLFATAPFSLFNGCPCPSPSISPLPTLQWDIEPTVLGKVYRGFCWRRRWGTVLSWCCWVFFCSRCRSGRESFSVLLQPGLVGNWSNFWEEYCWTCSCFSSGSNRGWWWRCLCRFLKIIWYSTWPVLLFWADR